MCVSLSTKLDPVQQKAAWTDKGYVRAVVTIMF